MKFKGTKIHQADIALASMEAEPEPAGEEEDDSIPKIKSLAEAKRMAQRKLGRPVDEEEPALSGVVDKPTQLTETSNKLLQQELQESPEVLDTVRQLVGADD